MFLIQIRDCTLSLVRGPGVKKWPLKTLILVRRGPWNKLPQIFYWILSFIWFFMGLTYIFNAKRGAEILFEVWRGLRIIFVISTKNDCKWSQYVTLCILKDGKTVLFLFMFKLKTLTTEQTNKAVLSYCQVIVLDNKTLKNNIVVQPLE